MRKDDGNFGEWAAQFYDGWMSAAGEELAATVAAAARASGRSETTLANAVHGALWERTKRSLGQVRLVVDECGAGGRVRRTRSSAMPTRSRRPVRRRWRPA